MSVFGHISWTKRIFCFWCSTTKWCTPLSQRWSRWLKTTTSKLPHHWKNSCRLWKNRKLWMSLVLSCGIVRSCISATTKASFVSSPTDTDAWLSGKTLNSCWMETWSQFFSFFGENTSIFLWQGCRLLALNVQINSNAGTKTLIVFASGVTVLSQGKKTSLQGDLSTVGPTNEHWESSEMTVKPDVDVYTKTRNHRKNSENANNNLLKTKRILEPKYRLSGVRYIWLARGQRFAPLSPRR